jgi:uncharacterized membrane protein YkoI
VFNTKLTLAGLVAGAAVAVAGGAVMINQAEAARRAELLAANPSAMDRDHALEVAQARFPGAELREDELECENGRLVYEFEFDTPEGTAEVAIDPVTGAVLEQSIEREDDADGEEDDDGPDAAELHSQGAAAGGVACEAEHEDDEEDDGGR